MCRVPPETTGVVVGHGKHNHFAHVWSGLVAMCVCVCSLFAPGVMNELAHIGTQRAHTWRNGVLRTQTVVVCCLRARMDGQHPWSVCVCVCEQLFWFRKHNTHSHTHAAVALTPRHAHTYATHNYIIIIIIVLTVHCRRALCSVLLTNNNR